MIGIEETAYQLRYRDPNGVYRLRQRRSGAGPVAG